MCASYGEGYVWCPTYGEGDVYVPDMEKCMCVARVVEVSASGTYAVKLPTCLCCNLTTHPRLTATSCRMTLAVLKVPQADKRNRAQGSELTSLYFDPALALVLSPSWGTVILVRPRQPINLWI